jgi:hypothetical protein
MTKNAILELKKIRKNVLKKDYKTHYLNSSFILEKNYISKDFKNYLYKRCSEFLKLQNEFSMISSFSELIFLNLFDQDQAFLTFNLLLRQTMEIMISQVSLYNIENLIDKFFKITSWNLVNPTLLLKFTYIHESLMEAKGLTITKEAKERKFCENIFNKEFSAVRLEKIRYLIDEKKFIVSGILINSFFRLNSWEVLGKSEKKVFSEQIIRILNKNQKFFLLANFYYIMLENGYKTFKICNFSKICVFLSTVCFRLSTNFNKISRLEKLLKTKIIDYLNFHLLCLFTNQLKTVFTLMNNNNKFIKTIRKIVPYLKEKCLDKIRKSLKKKLIIESISKISYFYKSIMIKNLKNFLKTDSQDLEYHLLSYLGESEYRFSIDQLRGILYFDLILK